MLDPGPRRRNRAAARGRARARSRRARRQPTSAPPPGRTRLLRPQRSSPWRDRSSDHPVRGSRIRALVSGTVLYRPPSVRCRRTGAEKPRSGPDGHSAAGCERVERARGSAGPEVTTWATRLVRRLRSPGWWRPWTGSTGSWPSSTALSRASTRDRAAGGRVARTRPRAGTRRRRAPGPVVLDRRRFGCPALARGARGGHRAAVGWAHDIREHRR